MKIDPSIYEDYEDFLDEEDVSFEKLTRKSKIAKQDKRLLIQQKRKEKMRIREVSESNEIPTLIDEDQERN